MHGALRDQSIIRNDSGYCSALAALLLLKVAPAKLTTLFG
jgi:hypothetical protein